MKRRKKGVADSNTINFLHSEISANNICIVLFLLKSHLLRLLQKRHLASASKSSPRLTLVHMKIYGGVWCRIGSPVYLVALFQDITSPANKWAGEPGSFIFSQTSNVAPRLLCAVLYAMRWDGGYAIRSNWGKTVLGIVCLFPHHIYFVCSLESKHSASPYITFKPCLRTRQNLKARQPWSAMCVGSR